MRDLPIRPDSHKNRRMTDPREIPVIDLFAGPGGLSEGFASYTGILSLSPTLSVEKDFHAHQTLELRTFYRQFPLGQAPKEYYEYIRARRVTRDALFSKYADEANAARLIAWHATLGEVPLEQLVERVRGAIGDAKHWVLIGGPPCQAYSTIGRARMTRNQNFSQDHRHTLYREYLKIVAALNPTIFVMENVKGILSSKLGNEKIFGRILNDLRAPLDSLDDLSRKQISRYGNEHQYGVYSFVKQVPWDEALEPNDYIIEAERFGVPQRRHRVILLGIRRDYDQGEHPTLESSPQEITVDEIIGSLPAIRSRLSSGDTDTAQWVSAIRRSGPLKGLSTKRFRPVKDCAKDAVAAMTDSVAEGAPFIRGAFHPRKLDAWLYDKRLRGVVQHDSRFHMADDLCRYLFAAAYATVTGDSPRLENFPRNLWPLHTNAVEDENGRVANFRDRFKVQVSDQPCNTVTAHLSKDGHYFIHPDPVQARSFTPREAARLQTFPDNYFFEGPRSKQFHQIGNAVPPYLAWQLADVVAEILENCLEQDRLDEPPEYEELVI